MPRVRSAPWINPIQRRTMPRVRTVPWINQIGVLHHGEGESEEWLRVLRSIVISRTKLPNLTERALVTRLNSYSLRALRYKVDNAILRQIPDADQTTTRKLLQALPIYSKSFRFMDLPPGIRLQVYKFYHQQSWINLSAYYEPRNRTKILVPALAHANSLIRQEFMPDIYRDMGLMVSWDSADSVISELVQALPAETLQKFVAVKVEMPWMSGQEWATLEAKPGNALALFVEELPDGGFENMEMRMPKHKKPIKLWQKIKVLIDALQLDETKSDYRGNALLALVKEHASDIKDGVLSHLENDELPG